ncbi:MAG: hypothetical protein ACI31M_04495 [Bacilli bacterium]
MSLGKIIKDNNNFYFSNIDKDYFIRVKNDNYYVFEKDWIGVLARLNDEKINNFDEAKKFLVSWLNKYKRLNIQL